MEPQKGEISGRRSSNLHHQTAPAKPARTHHASGKPARRDGSGRASDVIRSIEAGTNTFFVIDPYTGKRSEVGVVRPAGRAPYVRTHADGDWNDNLLSLNQCSLITNGENNGKPQARSHAIHIDQKPYESPNPTTGEALYKLGHVQPGL